eukprot:c39355_g1_i1 orf=1-1389(-)
MWQFETMPLPVVDCLSLSTWKVEGVGKFGQIYISPIRPGFFRSSCQSGRWKGRSVISCSVEGGEATEADNAGGPKRLPVSWLQLDSRAGAYGGWCTDENRSNDDMFAGWLKTGGALFLAIGISLGACSVYSRKGVVNGFAISVPVKEQIVSPFNMSDSSVSYQSMNKGELINEAKQNMQKEEGEPFVEDVTCELQHEGTGITDQFCLPLVEAEVLNEKDGNSTLCTANTAATAAFTVEPASSEAIELEEFQERSISNSFSEQETLGSYSTTDVDKKASAEVIISSDVADISSEMLSERQASLPGLSAMAFCKASCSNEGEWHYVSPLEEMAFKDEILNELPKQSDIFDGSLVDALDDNRLSTESKGNDMHEFALHCSSLSDSSEVAQNEASQLHDSSESSREVSMEMASIGQFESDESKLVIETFPTSPKSEHWHLTFVGIPAPITPSSAAEATLGRVLVPAP